MKREAICRDLLYILREYRRCAPHRLRELLLAIFEEEGVTNGKDDGF
jgi:hypothetical protein